MSTPVPPDLITPKAAARIIKSHISTIYRWIAGGRLQAYRRGANRYLVSRAVVEAQLVEVIPLPEMQSEAEERERYEATIDRLRQMGVKLN